MTCIVGIAKDGKVYIGADSCASNSHLKHRSERPKVFKNGDFIIGYTSSFRMGQLLEFEWSPPARDEGNSDYQYLIKQAIPSIQKLFKDHRFGKEKDSEQQGGTFIVGYKGRVYYVQDDFSVIEPSDGFYSVGSGEEWALGSLYSTRDWEDPVKRIEMAISAAEYYCCTVSGPIVILSD